jgi:hypothetical protein
LVDVGSIRNQKLGNKGALVRVFAEEIHHEVEWSLAVAVGLVYVRVFLDKSLDQPDFKSNNCEMQWTPVNTAS